MRFEQSLAEAELIRRYKRFLADVRLPDGSELTAHCPNTGSMMGCAEPGSRVWLSVSDSPRRKYRHTWEMVEVATGARVGIHTGRTNALVREAIEAGVFPELGGFRSLRAEKAVDGLPMRADFHLADHADGADAFVEVKNVTAAVDGDGVAIFPDAVSARGTRHLEVLRAVVGRGGRAAMIFCAQRDDVREVRPADAIDPAYGRALRAAIDDGVEVMAVRCRVTPEEIRAVERIPVHCPVPSEGS